MTVVAAVQMASGPHVEANLLEAERLIAKAAENGAQLIVLPENFAQMSRESDKLTIREKPGDGPLQSFLSRQAARHQIWLVGGTIPLWCEAEDKVRAACLLFDAHGQLAARYDKMHLFDVHIEESQESYRESATIEPGHEPVVAETPFGRLGLTVCYDLRFPELFRALLDQGMEILVLPAAFTAVTGKAHWEVLLRARAIENQCYVIASAQGGYHVTGRETHGHSMIIDPWGSVLECLAKGPGVVSAEVERERMASIRRSFPAIHHRHPALHSEPRKMDGVTTP
ncbi:MAG: carbon-nitrogen hydrolase family protein [Candidatus Competibacteraceae bacterium]|jgi:nitrilase|nr:carbon-nitrogen hydrolase family protein [Candidatus Competibacteraceae bacterium]